MKVDEVLTGVRDTITVKRVYGDPYERDGVAIIPAAAISGAGGGGGGTDGDSEGGGLGYGIGARPVGAYVIRNGEVDWVPATDDTRITLVGNIVAIVAILAARSLLKTVVKRRSKS